MHITKQSDCKIGTIPYQSPARGFNKYEFEVTLMGQLWCLCSTRRRGGHTELDALFVRLNKILADKNVTTTSILALIESISLRQKFVKDF
jgi:hypothetical protein